MQKQTVYAFVISKESTINCIQFDRSKNHRNFKSKFLFYLPTGGFVVYVNHTLLPFLTPITEDPEKDYTCHNPNDAKLMIQLTYE